MKTLTLLSTILMSSQLLAGGGGEAGLTAATEKPALIQAITTGANYTLTEHNSVAVVGPIGQSTASDFISALTSIQTKSVTIYLDSPGGSVIAGNSMIEAMRSSGKTTNCVAKFAASMAFGILQACDNRYLTRDGIIMQHTMSYMVGGAAPQNRSLVGLFQRIEDEMDRFQAERLEVSLEEFRYKTIRDYWLYSVDAVTDKAADGLATVSCEKELIKKKVVRTIRSFFRSFQVQMSACPLLLKMEPVKRKRKGRGFVGVDLESFKTPQAIKKLNTY